VHRRESRRHLLWLLRRREDAGGGLVAAVTREVGEIDPTLPFVAFRSMDDRIASSATQQRFHMYLIGACALLAVVLAGAGLFGVISYSVAQRTQEMGIRLALGATARQLVGSIVGQGALMAGLGLVIGLAGAFAATRVLKSFVFGVSTTDPLTFVAAAALLALVALAASLVPAWRVTRLDPALTLRRG
jgi:ABC-type antimicrobial peptide transport system permease subunit